ncbi:MAG: alanine--tRNA ligase, partial [Acidimicrobiia bacterium]|nr:alanine--tRNA ligase [Acidimicrobiia bacterium]
FYADRDHLVVPSASLIPIDPTLLLTNAGMAPFKPFLLGEQDPPHPRAVSVQKCARTVDIDIVGTTARHLTFFEMMGNFSFGEYFKEKAIPWAYELATEGYGLDPERLWYTVHISDDEAAEIWIDGVGVPAERVQRLDKDNFWQMGVPGPCGPSSELFYDKGPEHGEDGGPAVDDERFMEFYNLVFMQHVQDEPYHVVGDLPAKNIDTGLGLERMASLLQGTYNIFETDAIRPVLAAGERVTGLTLGDDERSDVSLRLMADHGRSITFLIGDKVVPSNEGRGYVLRRLLRRTVRHAYLYGTEDLIMPELVRATTEVMSEAYPELKAKEDFLVEVVSREEHAFRRTLASGVELLDEELDRLEEGATLPGETAFKLHDTYGFPIDVTAEILGERGVELDRNGFEHHMEVQRARSKEAFKGSDAAAALDEYIKLLRGVDATEFVGYESESAQGKVVAIVREGATVNRAELGEKVEIFLDTTPFYAESGGQVGDSGVIRTATGSFRVFDTQFAIAGVRGHRGEVVDGEILGDQEVTASIDTGRREMIRKNHTGTHMLHWGLREVLGEHANQAGSLVEPERLRFDFSHFSGLAAEELRAVESLVNERIVDNADVTTVETTKEQAEAMGALAFFGDKYGDEVRVVKTGDYSTEFCGGTHVRTTGQVGPLILVSEGSVAANTRRVEAVTGVTAYQHLLDLRRQIEDAESALRAQPGQLVSAATSLSERLRAQEDRIEEFESQARGGLADQLLSGADAHGTHKLVAATAPGLNAGDLRALAFQVRDKIGSGIGVIGSAAGGKGALVAFVTADLVEAGLSAGVIAAAGAEVLGGGGSRDPELSQAGGPNGAEIDAAVARAANAAQEALASV